MNALRHGLAASQSNDHLVWEQVSSPSLEEVTGRLRQIEAERLKLLSNINRSLAEGSAAELPLALKQLEALNRYIRRAYAKLRQRSE
jgi:hypothetical protein